MQKKILSALLAGLLVLTCFCPAAARASAVQVHLSAGQTSRPLAKHLFGYSLEGETLALETGLYANLVYNSAFEETGVQGTVPGWALFGAYTVEEKGGISENSPHYLVLPEGKKQQIKSLGFCEENIQTRSKTDKKSCKASMGIDAGESYVFSAYFKNTNTIVTVSLENEKGEKLSETNTFIVTAGSAWTPFTFPLSAVKTDYGYLCIEFAGGPVSIDNVSLTPKENYGEGLATWQNVTLRKDIFTALREANPDFLRFSVPCSVNAHHEASTSWKQTVGRLENRKPISVLPTYQTDYFAKSHAIGYHELLQLCEDIGALPIPTVYLDPILKPLLPQETTTAGQTDTTAEDASETTAADRTEKPTEKKFTLKKTDETETTAAPVSAQDGKTDFSKALYMPDTPQWQSFLHDALDMLAYAINDKSLPLGAARAANGHSAPYPLYYVCLDSEGEKTEAYLYAAQLFKAALQKAYPNVTVFVSTDAEPQNLAQADNTQTDSTQAEDGAYILQGVPNQNSLSALTEQIAGLPQRKMHLGLDVYAQPEKPRGKVQKSMNMEKALQEAILMLTLEQNSENISMATLASAFTRMDIPHPNSAAVLFNAHAAMKTPSYYVQQLFMNHEGTAVLEVPQPEGTHLYQSVTVDEQKQLLYIKLINNRDSKEKITYTLEDFGAVRYADTISVSASKKSSYNDVGRRRVSPTQTKLPADTELNVTVPENSVTVVRVALGENKADEQLFHLPNTPEPTKRYTTEEKMAFSAIGAAVVTAGGALYLTVYLIQRKKHKAKSAK